MTGVTLVLLAGIGQLVLAVSSLAIPRMLGWREELARLSPLTRSVFWTYAAYILGTNVALGLVSVLAPDALLDGGVLAQSVCAYAAIYWGVRLVVQFAAFGKHSPPGSLFRVAEVALTSLFAFLTAVYAGAATLWIGPGSVM